MKKISITDITFKKLAEDRNIELLFREKTAVAVCADALGVSAIELAPVKNKREDAIIYKTIAQKVKNAVLALPVGFDKEDVLTAWECINAAKNPRLQIEVPVSTVQMEYTYHIKSDKMLSKIGELVKTASELCSDVEFVARDATRADEEFLIAAVKEAENCGAGMITVCDDAGVMLPGEISALVSKVKAVVSVPVYLQASDRINLGVASAIAAISDGADGIKCAMAGKDVVLTGKLSDAINACSVQLGAETMLNNTKIHSSVDEMLSNISHDEYMVESEISEKKKILIDSDSTLSSVVQAVSVLGYDLSDKDCGNVYKELMNVCSKKGAVGAKELEAVIAGFAMQAPSTYHLESYTTSSSNLTGSMSQVVLKCDGELISGVSTGEGPIDSSFRAIEQCIGYHYELDDFQVQSVTEGKEALGSALVRLRNNGKLYSGNGTSTDIVAASIRAYVNALNKIVFEEA